MLAKAVFQSTSMLNLPASSRASPLPQGSVVLSLLGYITGPNVGAGLPAKAVFHSTSMLNLPASSRASPLPQGSVVLSLFGYITDPNVGAGLLAKAVFQSTSMLNLPAPSRAGSLPQGSVVVSLLGYITDPTGFCGGITSWVHHRSHRVLWWYHFWGTSQIPQGQVRRQTLSSRNSRSHELITRLKFSCSARFTATYPRTNLLPRYSATFGHSSICVRASSMVMGRRRLRRS